MAENQKKDFAVFKVCFSSLKVVKKIVKTYGSQFVVFRDNTREHRADAYHCYSKDLREAEEILLDIINSKIDYLKKKKFEVVKEVREIRESLGS